MKILETVLGGTLFLKKHPVVWQQRIFCSKNVSADYVAKDDDGIGTLNLFTFHDKRKFIFLRTGV